ncbi:MAG: glycosyltransferase family 39 protein [Limnothrix sp.]
MVANKKDGDDDYFAVALTLLWGLVGTILRVIKLGKKPPWTDEFATILYSRGDDYSSIPIGEILTADSLLAPLKGDPVNGLGQVAELLISQNNHPPLYFMGMNVWQRFLPLDEGGYVSIFGVRSPSVIFGILGIFGIYWVAKWAFSSEIIAQLAAALMAVSPFAVYLSQEARHYSLIILWAIASFFFCFYAIQLLIKKRQLSYRFVISWLVFNCVGLLIHYFFLLTIMGQAIALIWLVRQHQYSRPNTHWFRFGLVVLGLGIFGLVWKLQVLPDSYGSTMTDWIRLDRTDWFDWIRPSFQLVNILITMIILLPIQADSLPIAIISSLIMVVVAIRLVIFWRRGIKIQIQNLSYQPYIFFLSRFVFSVWGLFMVLTFGFGIDITREARYSFTYFPAVILLLALGLSAFWQQENVTFFGFQKLFRPFSKSGSQAIALILTISLLGSIVVVQNWAYQKPYDPEAVLARIQQNPQPALILTPYKSTVQIGEMMAIAWEKYRQSSPQPLSFAFIPTRDQPKLYEQNIEALLSKRNLNNSETIQLWTINFFEKLTIKGCKLSGKNSEKGYYSDVYYCADVSAKTNANLDSPQ